VNNLLQVVPSEVKELVAANDSDVKERVEASLKADIKMKDVNVASVNNGVVLKGVHRVASELQTIEN
jgi:osmotically-inducible protein OsmY